MMTEMERKNRMAMPIIHLFQLTFAYKQIALPVHPPSCHAQQNHIRIPEDVSIVSFDDVYLAQMAHPALTTIHQDIGEKGRQAVQLVLDAAKSNEHHHTECILPLSLVERESVCERRDDS